MASAQEGATPSETPATSYWGPIASPSDSVTSQFANRPTPLWEKTLLAPYYIVRAPFSLINAGAREAITYMDETGAVKKVQKLLGPQQGPFGLMLNVTSGSLTGLGGGITAYHDAFFSPKNRFRLGLQSSQNGHHRATTGVTIPVSARDDLEFGAGYRMRPNTRFFGIGPDTDASDESFVRNETSWFGTSFKHRIAGHAFVEAGALYSLVGTRGPRSKDDPTIDEQFAGRLPAGHRERSDGVTLSLALIHDDTKETGRPESGGVRTLKAGHFKSTDGSEVAFWNYRGEFQQFIPLWHTKRAFALRGFASWLENTGDDEIPFQRLMTNDDPDLLRGYKDTRWTDRGMIAFSSEYRWPVWNEKFIDRAGLDMYVLADVGQVFGDADEISRRNMTDSWGLGLRLIGNKGFVGRIEYATSNEESVLRVRADQVFQFAKNGIYHGRNPIPVR
ncbi:MAG: BamA/TamA family outer membrane protein [bacterium]